MKPKISLVTLGVADMEKSTKFYTKFGFKEDKNNDSIVFFKLDNLTLALYPRNALAEDAGIAEEGSGFRGFSLAYNVDSAHHVDATLNKAKKAGATIIKPGQKVFWGGYSGYFADPDGFLWEVAWNPFMEL